MSSRRLNRNILSYEGCKVEILPTVEVFVFVEIEKGEPMEAIASELNAIEKMMQIKEFHEENGIKKNELYYDYFKMQTMALNDSGYKRVSQHIFKDEKGENVQTHLN